MTANDAFQRAKAYIKKSLIGAGALKGKSPRIGTATHDDANKLTEIPVTWYNDDGSVYETTTLYIPDGKDGESQTIEVTQSGRVTTISVDGVVKATINDGADGGEGKSAFQIAQEQGFVGTKQEWLDSLVGKTGRSIVSVQKTSTSGLEDTYTGTFSDGSTFSFKVTNGANITKVSQLQNDEEFIKRTVENLANYYLKTELYNKNEIDDLMRNIGAGLALSIVESLPTVDISPTTIYLIKTNEVTTHTDYVYKDDAWVLAENSGLDTSRFEIVDVSSLPASGMLSDKIYRITVTNTTYAQYIRIGNAWANLGSTGTNLTNYYDKAQITIILESYVSKDELTNILEDYALKDELGAAATSNDYNDLDNKPDIPEVEAEDTDVDWEEELR